MVVVDVVVAVVMWSLKKSKMNDWIKGKDSTLTLLGTLTCTYAFKHATLTDKERKGGHLKEMSSTKSNKTNPKTISTNETK